MPLSELDYKRIIIALETQERVSSPIMRSEWRVVLKNFLAEVQPFVSDVCRCEDRPCCSCDKDYYRNENNEAPDYEAIRERQEDDQMRWEMLMDVPCSICKEYFTDEDNEDDVVQSFHAECAESGNE